MGAEADPDRPGHSAGALGHLRAAAPKRGVGWGAQQGPPCPQVPSTPGCAGTPAVTVPTGTSLASTDAGGAWTGSAGGRTDGHRGQQERAEGVGAGRGPAARHGWHWGNVAAEQGADTGGAFPWRLLHPHPRPHSSCQAGGEFRRRIWGAPRSWHRYSELPGAPPRFLPSPGCGWVRSSPAPASSPPR